MKLWLIEQDVNDDYDTYDSAVVAANTEDEARTIHPSEFYEWGGEEWMFIYSDGRRGAEGGSTVNWCSPDDVKVTLLGEAAGDVNFGVVLSSFNAG